MSRAFSPQDLKFRRCGTWSCCSHSVPLRLGLEIGASVKDNKKEERETRHVPVIAL